MMNEQIMAEANCGNELSSKTGWLLHLILAAEKLRAESLLLGQPVEVGWIFG